MAIKGMSNRSNTESLKTQNNSGNWAILLGASGGLGLATAKKLAKHGYNILLVHRDRKADMDKIEKDFQEIMLYGTQFKSFNADATNPQQRSAIVTELAKLVGVSQKIKVLVHSIAKGNLKPMHSNNERELDHNDFAITIAAMGISLYDWVKELVAANLFGEDTRIISFTSEGNTKALANYAAVSAAKVVLEAITRNIALEFAPLGIKANCIQAGITETRSFTAIPGSDQLKRIALARNPSGRLTTPEDVANAVYLLCLDEAKWITGTILKVDGGESLH